MSVPSSTDPSLTDQLANPSSDLFDVTEAGSDFYGSNTSAEQSPSGGWYESLVNKVSWLWSAKGPPKDASASEQEQLLEESSKPIEVSAPPPKVATQSIINSPKTSKNQTPELAVEPKGSSPKTSTNQTPVLVVEPIGSPSKTSKNQTPELAVEPIGSPSKTSTNRSVSPPPKLAVEPAEASSIDAAPPLERLMEPIADPSKKKRVKINANNLKNSPEAIAKRAMREANNFELYANCNDFNIWHESKSPSLLGRALNWAASKVPSKSAFSPQNLLSTAKAYIPQGIQNRAINLVLKAPKAAIKQSAQENLDNIRMHLEDPQNFEASMNIILDYTTSFLRGVVGDYANALPIDQQKDFFYGLALKIFIKGLPENGKRISSVDLLANGVVHFLEITQQLYKDIEIALEREPDPKRRFAIVKEHVTLYLTQIFPNKEKELGRYYVAGVRTVYWRGLIWFFSNQLDTIFKGIEDNKQLNPFSQHPFVTDNNFRYPIQSFISKLAKYTLSIGESSVKEPEDVEKLLQRMKPIIRCPDFREQHPPTIINLLKKIFESKDPRTRYVMGEFSKVVKQFVEAIVLNQLTPHVDRIQDLKNLEGDAYIAKRNELLEFMFQDSFLNIGEIILSSFDNLNKQCAASKIHWAKPFQKIESKVYYTRGQAQEIGEKSHEEQTKKLVHDIVEENLDKLLHGRADDLPGWLCYFLGGKTQAWPFVVSVCADVVFDFYKAIFPTPNGPLYIGEYKQKLAGKLAQYGGSAQEIENDVNNAINEAQKIADTIFSEFVDSLVNPDEGQSEFEELEKWLQKLRPLLSNTDFPENHPEVFLRGLKSLLLSNNERAIAIKSTIKTYLGHLCFKFAVNAIFIDSGNRRETCPKHLLLANGLSKLLMAVAKPTRVTEDQRETEHFSLTPFHKYMKEHPPLKGKVDPAILEERQKQDRKGIQYFVNDVLSVLLPGHPDLGIAPGIAPHIPLSAPLQKELGKDIETKLLPDIAVETYVDMTPLMREAPQERIYLEKFARNQEDIRRRQDPKRTHTMTEQAAHRPDELCKLGATATLAAIPLLISRHSIKVAGLLYDEILYPWKKKYPNVGSAKDLPQEVIAHRNKLIPFIADNLKKIVHNKPLMAGLQSAFNEYTYALLLTVTSSFVRVIEKVENTPIPGQPPLFARLFEMIMHVLTDHIQTLNDAREAYNKERGWFKSGITHVSLLPPEVAVMAFAKKNQLDPAFKIVHQAGKDATPEQINEIEERHLHKPLAVQVVAFGNLDKLKSIPFPRAFSKKLWKSTMDGIIPGVIGKIFEVIHSPATKVEMILSLLGQFEKAIQESKEARQNTRKGSNIQPVSGQDEIDDYYSDEFINKVGSMVRELLRLAPRNLFTGVYRNIGKVEEGTNQGVGSVLRAYLDSQSVSLSLDLLFEIITKGLHPGEYDPYGKYQPRIVTYEMKHGKVERFEGLLGTYFPDTEEQLALKELFERQRAEENNRKAPIRLNDLVAEGARVSIGNQLNDKKAALWNAIKDFLTKYFGVVGEKIAYGLEKCYDFFAEVFYEWLLKRPISWIADFIFWLVRHIIKRDTRHQIKTLTDKVSNNAVNKFVRGFFDVLTDAKGDPKPVSDKGKEPERASIVVNLVPINQKVVRISDPILMEPIKGSSTPTRHSPNSSPSRTPTASEISLQSFES